VSGKLLQFGAGNIGRSFIGQLFSRGGYEVVFVDVNDRIVSELNRRGRYRVVIKRDDLPDEELDISGVRAVDGRDAAAVGREVADANYIATSVGQSALKTVLPLLAEALRNRYLKAGEPPVDIIIAENVRGGARLFRQELARRFPQPELFGRMVGLVETSIGKMVPIMPQEEVDRDPLLVFAEPYNTLVVDGKAFRSSPPPIEGVKLVDNITAYVDRKLFIHNLGHACCAYISYAHDPSVVTIADAVRTVEVRDATRRAMMQAAAALADAYPETFSLTDLEEHVTDLIRRFGNRALGDTIHRVGRDLYRKLHKEDRLVGAMLLAERHGLPYDSIAAAFVAALSFAAPGPDGALYPRDRNFRERELSGGPRPLLRKVCELDPGVAAERSVIESIAEASH